MGLTESESLDGLKFGQKIYFEDVGVGVPKPGQGRKCVVEGCRVDLSDAKGYYWRHKVCSMHSKTPKVIVAGLEQRFCQQCSRFHLLAEFDQGKRSCRRRLAGHNERRRKPPLFSSRYGSFLMDFTAYPRLPRARFSATASHLPHHPWHANASSHIFPPGVSHSTRMNNLMNTGGVLVAMSQAAAVNHFPKASWGFNGNEVGNSANGVLPDSGTGQNQFSGELELSQQGRRHYVELRHSEPYDSTQQMHRSL